MPKRYLSGKELIRVFEREHGEIKRADRLLKEAEKNIERIEGRKFLSRREKRKREIRSVLHKAAHKKGSAEARDFMKYVRSMQSSKKKDKLEKEKEKGQILRIRTIKPNPHTYIYVGIRKGRGVRGGKTVSGPVHKL